MVVAIVAIDMIVSGPEDATLWVEGWSDAEARFAHFVSWLYALGFLAGAAGIAAAALTISRGDALPGGLIQRATTWLELEMRQPFPVFILALWVVTCVLAFVLESFGSHPLLGTLAVPAYLLLWLSARFVGDAISDTSR